MVACLKDGAGLVIYLFNGNDRDDHQKFYQRKTPSSLSDLRSTRFNFRGKIGSERMSPRSGGGSSRFRPRGGLRWESWDRRSHVEAVQVVFSGSFEPHSQVEEALEVIAGGHQGPFEVHFL